MLPEGAGGHTKSDVAIEGACDDLWIGLLTDEAADCLSMTAQNVAVKMLSVCDRKGTQGIDEGSHIAPRSHIPNSCHTITTTSHQHVQRRM